MLLPALGGDVRCYAALVQQLSDEQPIYAFRPRGVDQDLPPHLAIDEMIGDYLAALRTLQPAGPYYLAGWSAGGIFAFALAEAIERAGEEVGLIAMIDAPLPSIFDNVNVEDDARFLCELVSFASRFSGTDVQIPYEELSKLPPEEQFPAALAEARKSGIVPADTPESFIRRLVRVGEANVRAAAGLRAQSAIEADPVVRAGQQNGTSGSLGRRSCERRGLGVVEPDWPGGRTPRSARRSFHDAAGRRGSPLARELERHLASGAESIRAEAESAAR